MAAGCAAAGTNTLLACGGPGPSGKISAGTVNQLAVGTLRGVPGESVAIGRDEKGLYALTLICTHAGCDMESQGSVSASGIRCYCHGSMFDANGDVVQGPARSALEHFAVTVDAGGNITIDADTPVASSVRTPV